MRTIAHISDLHFGRVDERLLDPLFAGLEAARPDVVAISGDLTQRARERQFRAAARFLARLRWPLVVVPGNHDVPLFNVFARFAHPLRGFRRHIAAEPTPFYADDEVAVLGINTARSLTWKAGSASTRVRSQHARARLCALAARRGEGRRDAPSHSTSRDASRRGPGRRPRRHGDDGARGLRRGRAAVGPSAPRAHRRHRAATASPATRRSWCRRARRCRSARASETNSFNVLHAERDRVRVEHHLWDRVERHASASPERKTSGVTATSGARPDRRPPCRRFRAIRRA